MGATDQVEFRTAVERRRSRRRADARRDARGGQEAARAGAPPATAIVMGLGTTGLGVARSLHARGIPVIGLDSARTPASRSRTLRFMTRPGFGDDATALAFFIGLAGRLGGRPVLCPVSEREVSFVARHQAELREHYRFLVADAGTIERAVSKQGHIEWAEQFDLPAPRTHAVIDADGVEMAAASLRFPVVMKPDDPAAWRDGRLAGTGFEKAKAIPAEDADELRRAYARVSAAGPAVVIQEMVVGDDPSHFSYHVLIDGDGVTRAEFVGRKHRLAPPHFGVGTYVESVQDAEILAAGREVARRIGYRGGGEHPVQEGRAHRARDADRAQPAIQPLGRARRGLRRRSPLSLLAHLRRRPARGAARVGRRQGVAAPAVGRAHDEDLRPGGLRLVAAVRPLDDEAAGRGPVQRG